MIPEFPAVIDPTIGLIVAALIGGLGTYLVAARRFSGKIGSSDASELWKESRSIREWSQERIEELTSTVKGLERRVSHVEAQNADLGEANSGLVQQIRDLSDTITELRAEIVQLTKELQQANERVVELEGEINEEPPTTK
jgi:chromosome segregation ATPase